MTPYRELGLPAPAVPDTIDKHALPKGQYTVTLLSGAQYLAEHREDGWFLIDGVGWEQSMPDDITAAVRVTKGWAK